MPTERVLTIAGQRATTPTWNQVHGLACALVGEQPDEHTSAAPKRWSVTLRPAGAGLQLGVRFLDDTRPLPAPPADLRLGAHRYTVVGVEDRTIAYGQLLSGSAATAVRMEHLTPTALSVASDRGPDGARGPKRYLPLPDPVAVYRGLAARWNANAPEPLRLPDPVTAELTARVALAEHDIRTVVADIGAGSRPGFVGTVVYVLAGSDRDDEARRAFTALSGFAELCGVGGQTTHGLGAVAVAFARDNCRG